MQFDPSSVMNSSLFCFCRLRCCEEKMQWPKACSQLWRRYRRTRLSCSVEFTVWSKGCWEVRPQRVMTARLSSQVKTFLWLKSIFSNYISSKKTTNKYLRAQKILVMALETSPSLPYMRWDVTPGTGSSTRFLLCKARGSCIDQQSHGETTSEQTNSPSPPFCYLSSAKKTQKLKEV